MVINGVSSPITYTAKPVQSVTTSAAPSATPETKGAGFGEQITSAIDKVDALQKTADTSVAQVASGSTEDTHKAMINMERALLALDFTLQVRNKMLEAYQEIMRTQL